MANFTTIRNNAVPLDFTDERLVIGDKIPFIEKTTRSQEKLEQWSEDIKDTTDDINALAAELSEDDVIQARLKNRLTFATYADLNAFGAPPDAGTSSAPLAEVWNDPEYNGVYGWTGTQWLRSTQTIFEQIFSETGKNLIDPSLIRAGYYYSPGAGSIIANTSWRMTGFIPIEEGETYTMSGASNPFVAYFTDRNDDADVGVGTMPTFTVPIGQSIKYVAINITNQGANNTSYDDLIQLEVGGVITEHEAFTRRIPFDNIEGLEELLSSFVSTVDFTEKNLLDPSQIDYKRRYTTGSSTLITDTIGIAASGYIEVQEGEWYTLSGDGIYGITSTPQGGYYSAIQNTGVSNIVFISNSDGSKSFQVPAGQGIRFALISLRKKDGSSSATTLHGDAQIEAGQSMSEFEPYFSKKLIPHDKVQISPGSLLRADVIESGPGVNLLNPDEFDTSRRYSVGNKGFVVDSLPIAASGYIEVQEGEWYTLSGDGIYGITSTPQGGFFIGSGDAVAVDNIVFTAPVDNVGKAFQVPTGLNIRYVVISLAKDGNGEVTANAQMQNGEQATDYVPFELRDQIRPELLPVNVESSSGVGDFNAAAFYKFVEGYDNYSQSHRIPKFKKHWLARDKDLTVVNTGTSLTARSGEHCPAHPDAAIRPPSMHSYNFVSIIWDRLVSGWQGQKYRRYDSDYFTESGSFLTSSNPTDGLWGDGPYHQGWTRYSDANAASVAFDVPVDAWQFNWIYRTDSVSSSSVSVSIAEGNEKMEVYNGSAWVEANGYTFSAVESAPVVQSVMVPMASTGEFVERSITTKRDTTYQKRLKFRCKSGLIDSRSTAKRMTVSAATGRLCYWGVEWSPREYMITYINAARGSHNTQADNTRGLPKFADNEVWGFEPDLMLFELPTHNDGAAAAGSYPGGYWERLTDHFVFNQSYQLSMASRAEHFGLSPEYVMFTASIAWNFTGIDDDGDLILGEQGDGSMMSALDKYSQSHNWITENHPEVTSINAAQRWVDAGYEIFGDMKSATVGSGKGGPTMTNEGSHWNQTGSKIMAKAVLPVLNFER